MNVKELVEILKDYPENMDVLVESYEEGYDPLTSHREVSVSEHQIKEWYYGVFDEDKSSEKKMLLLFSKFNRNEKDKNGK